MILPPPRLERSAASFLPAFHNAQCIRSPWLRRKPSCRAPEPWKFNLVLAQKQVFPPTPDRMIFIFGLGYVGLALARYLQGEGWDVSGTCSSSEKRELLEGLGLRAFRFNSDNDGEGLEQAGLQAMGSATHVITTIPPVADFDKDPVLSMYRQQLVHTVLHRNLNWIGYLSSTGVYGDFQGDWVDENSQPKPVDKRAVARLEAEQAWLQLGRDSGVCVQIFRLGGIYGPGRSAIDTLLHLDKVSLKQRARQGRRYTSRIHVADICQVIAASMQSPSSGRLYNVVDNDPAPRADVFSFARDLIEEKWPHKMHTEIELVNPVATDGREDFGSLQKFPEKRVLNKRLVDELKVELLHPSYKSGLKAVIEELDCSNFQ